jgi:chitin disaccharide deacetylase
MSDRATRVIFNADDFGLAPAVNAAVVQLCRQGIVRSASLLVTGPAAEEAIALARERPELGVGLHLALVHERPASLPRSTPDLRGPEGKLLLGYGPFMMAWWKATFAGRQLIKQVHAEATAQINMMVSAGLPPTHLDSHQHLHQWPPIFNLCVELCRQHSIPFLRVPRLGALDVGKVPVAWSRRALMSLLIRRVRQRALPEGLARADGVWGMAAAGHLDEPLLVHLLGQLPPGLHEIMCHPATEPCDAYTRHPWHYDWAQETAALGSESVAQMIRERRITVTNFREAAAAP